MRHTPQPTFPIAGNETELIISGLHVFKNQFWGFRILPDQLEDADKLNPAQPGNLSAKGE